MIEFLNPDADVGIENTPYDLSVKVDGDNDCNHRVTCQRIP